MVHKIRTVDPQVNKLLELCKREPACGDCDTLRWVTPKNNVRTRPPENTAMIVVDVRDNKGAIYIHETQGDNYVDGVGTEEAGNLVIFPWNHDWYYYTIGTLELGYVGKEEESQ